MSTLKNRRDGTAMGDQVAPDAELLNVASMFGVVANIAKNVARRLSTLCA